MEREGRVEKAEEWRVEESGSTKGREREIPDSLGETDVLPAAS